MERARKREKSAKRLPTPQEEARRSGVLLEEIGANVSAIAQNHVALSHEFQTFKAALLQVGEDIKLMKPAIERNTRDIGEIKDRLSTIENDVRIVKTDVKGFTQRLEALESKGVS